MHSFEQTLRVVLGTFCVGLASLIVGEMVLSVADVAALQNDPPADATKIAPLPALNVDELATAILDRPLFTPGRRPPAPPAPPAQAVKTAPQLNARLAGMTVGPNEREALFARDGGTVVAIHEQQAIDGWTVTSIDAEKVVLHSDFGEQVLHPTEGSRAMPLRPGLPRVQQAAAARPPANAPANGPARQQPTTGAKGTGKNPRP
jgi:hypothetical protein